MWVVELLVVLFFIWLGARMGSIGIGFAGGFGVVVLGFVFGLEPGSIPTDVILIIMAVISAIAAMQEAGGLDYLVHLAEKILKRNPKYIIFFCKVEAKNILNVSTFKSGMSACICVLGVAWLGTTFVANHIEEINVFAGNLLESKPWMLAVVLFFAAMLLYSQAATTKALMPAALALGISPVAAVASFAAVSALFVLPTYPSLLAAVEFDDTGSTQIGKYVFDHPFLIPGTVTIVSAVILGFVFGGIFL